LGKCDLDPIILVAVSKDTYRQATVVANE
jgi:hypothetical protein